jgi:predicted PurR-regulated permease PerM
LGLPQVQVLREVQYLVSWAYLRYRCRGRYSTKWFGTASGKGVEGGTVPSELGLHQVQYLVSLACFQKKLLSTTGQQLRSGRSLILHITFIFSFLLSRYILRPKRHLCKAMKFLFLRNVNLKTETIHRTYNPAHRVYTKDLYYTGCL